MKKVGKATGPADRNESALDRLARDQSDALVSNAARRVQGQLVAVDRFTSAARLTGAAKSCVALGVQVNPMAQSNILEAARKLAEAMVAVTKITTTRHVFADLDRFVAANKAATKLATRYTEITNNRVDPYAKVASALTGPFADIARTNQWASKLAMVDGSKLAALFPAVPKNTETERIHRAAVRFLNLSTDSDRRRMSSVLGLTPPALGALQATQMKLSALAGAGDILGFESKAGIAAYQQLFGTWRTLPDLPPRFWRDPSLRRQHYAEADVDPGLIEATPAEGVDVVIGSGLLAGTIEGESATVLVDVAGVTMRIRAGKAGADAFQLISAFEQELRDFIARKLAAVAGPQWFKHNVDGKMRQKARESRAAAMSSGETERALIAFLDLGDLMGIILRNDNWNMAFGGVFPDRQRFEFDFRALIASRRPTMHARKVDAVRLVELLCIVRRLTQWIESDGEWKRIADSED